MSHQPHGDPRALAEDRARPAEVSLRKKLGLGAGREEAATKSIEHENQDLECLASTTWPGLHLNLGSMKGDLSLLVTAESPTANTALPWSRCVGHTC